MKKVLVPIDFSDFSMNALEVACYIAKVKDLQVHVLHVIDDSYTPYYNLVGMNMIEDSSVVNYRKDLQQSVNEQIKNVVEKLKEKNVTIETEVIIDRVYKGILNNALDKDVDLIVIGSHGHNDVEDIFLGSTTEKIIRLSSIPVLTVHETSENYKIDKIVFASDFEEEEVDPILKRVIDFAELFMAELFLVRVNTDGREATEESRNRLEAYAKRFGLFAGAITTYSDRSEEEGIVNYAREIDADLIAMCTHGRTGFSRFFRGSVAEEVAGYSGIPVLTYNISKETLSRSAQAVQRQRKDRIGINERTKKSSKIE